MGLPLRKAELYAPVRVNSPRIPCEYAAPTSGVVDVSA